MIVASNESLSENRQVFLFSLLPCFSTSEWINKGNLYKIKLCREYFELGICKL
uniref:Uncharacterized protein n=1 Tax=Populus trichocarpa TaxID=3694 RepID=A9PHK3_POPTR|nr:unknown [Populus trichocarpa]